MKVTLSWLREFARDIDGDPVELGETLSALGLAVEEMETIGEIVDGVVLAKVLDLRPHPDADKIQLVDVDRGDGQPLQVCCGAFNMTVGDLIPFATIGTVMPNGMEIAQREMRGQMSNGMCCAADEIGLVSGDDGIYILNDVVVDGAELISSATSGIDKRPIKAKTLTANLFKNLLVFIFFSIYGLDTITQYLYYLEVFSSIVVIPRGS